MSTIGEAILLAAGSLPVWRDSALVALAGIVIGSLYLYASLVGEP